jgi:hypothetical protein
VFENRVLRRIFGSKREKVVEGWRRLHEEVHNLYASSNIIRMIKSRTIRVVGHVARMGEMRNAYSILVRKPDGKRRLRRTRHGWKIILEWILGKWGYKFCIIFIWLRIGTSGELV